MENIIRLNLGTESNPHTISHTEKNDYIILESGVYIVRGSAVINDVRGSAVINDVGGSAVINDVRDSAVINDVRDSAVIKYVGGSAVIKYVRDSAVIKYVRDSAVINDVRGSAVIKYVGGSAVIKYVGGSAVIKYVGGSAVIKYVGGSAVIKYVGGSAVIKYVRDSAVIKYVGGSAVIKYVGGSAVIKYVGGSAVIKYVRDSAVINDFSGLVTVQNYRSNRQLLCKGFNVVRCDKAYKDNIILNDTSHVFINPEIESSFDVYSKMYKFEHDSKVAILYKAVHKIDGKYIADYDKRTEYKIGKSISTEADTSTKNSCSPGLHISPLSWALNFGRGWSDVAIIECEVLIKDIIVSADCDGKVRTPKLKVIREVPREEYEA